MTCMRRAVVPLAALVGLTSVPCRAAEAPFAANDREVRHTLAGAVNPAGLQDTLEASWSRRISASPRVISRDAHVAWGVASRVTPAYVRVGAWAEIAPLSIFELRVGAEPTAYFGTFHSLLGFSSYADRFDDEARKARSSEARAGAAGRVYAAPTLKARLGRLVFRSRAEVEWWKAGSGPYFYEPARDTLLKSSGDGLVTTETLLLVEVSSRLGRKLLLGPVHDLTSVFAASRNRKQDVGLMIVCGIGSHTLGLHEPTLVAKAFRYLEDPYKRGQIGAQLAISSTLGGGPR